MRRIAILSAAILVAATASTAAHAIQRNSPAKQAATKLPAYKPVPYFAPKPQPKTVPGMVAGTVVNTQTGKVTTVRGAPYNYNFRR